MGERISSLANVKVVASNLNSEATGITTASTAFPAPAVDFYLSQESDDGSSYSEDSDENLDDVLHRNFATLDIDSFDDTDITSLAPTPPLSPPPPPKRTTSKTWPTHPQPPSDDQIAALPQIPKWANDSAAESDFRLAEYYDSQQQYGAVAWQLYVAAGRGNVDAMYNMGVCYATGRGVQKNEETAMDYFHRAAMKGHPEAM